MDGATIFVFVLAGLFLSFIIYLHLMSRRNRLRETQDKKPRNVA
jgi:hypothetical protein